MEKDDLRVGDAPARPPVVRACLGILFRLGIWGVLLFWAAGTLAWTRAWIHHGLWIVTLVVNLAILLRYSPAMLAVRMRRQALDRKFDKVIVFCLQPAALSIPVVAGLDVVRCQWTLLPLWTMCPGALVHIVGDIFILWSMIANPFLEGAVRIQSERGHRAITTGPYAIVRHPMYVGIILLLAGIPLLLGSIWAFLPACVVVLLFVIRTAFEDRMLREELPGYDAYVLVTPHRLIPGIW